MSRKIYVSGESRESAPPTPTTGFADLLPLDAELASELPGWDLAPPNTFVVRKPRKPKPASPSPVGRDDEAKQVPPTAIPEQAQGTTLTNHDVSGDPVPLDTTYSPHPRAAEAATDEQNDVETATESDHDEFNSDATRVAASTVCWQCAAPLEPDASFCSECGAKQ